MPELAPHRVDMAIFEHFKALANNRTAVIVSHRFSTVRMAARRACWAVPPSAAPRQASR